MGSVQKPHGPKQLFVLPNGLGSSGSTSNKQSGEANTYKTREDIPTE